MRIVNQTDDVARRYGQNINAKSVSDVDNNLVQTYSLAESSQALQSIARSLTRLVSLMEQKNTVEILNTVNIREVPDPWQWKRPFKDRIKWFFKNLFRKAKPKWKL